MASSSSGVPIHSLLMQSGDYSDDCNGSATDDDEYHEDESEVEYVTPAATAETEWQQKCRSKRKQNQRQSDIKKSKLDSAGPGDMEPRGRK